MPRGNPSPKLAITVDPGVHQWMTEAAQDALKIRAGLEAVAEWEKEHGAFTKAELTEARRRVRAQMRMPRSLRHPA